MPSNHCLATRNNLSIFYCTTSDVMGIGQSYLLYEGLIGVFQHVLNTMVLYMMSYDVADFSEAAS